MCKIKFSSHKQYLLGLLLSSVTKKSHADQCIPQIFSSEKKTSHKVSKAAAAKTFFPSMHMLWYNLLR